MYSMYKKKPINKSLRNAVWISEFGISGIGKCYCCRIETITMGNFQCGHIKAESRGGHTVLQNLKPICALCNTSMGARNMNEFAVANGYRCRYTQYIYTAIIGAVVIAAGVCIGVYIR